MTTLAEFRGSRELVVNLTLRDLRGRYKRSLLGWSWSMVNPLATMLIFTLVFGYLLKVKVPPGRPSGLNVFALFLLCGLLPWNYLANAMNGSMAVVLGNSSLIKKVYFPREVLVASSIASSMVSFFIELGVLAVALVLAGNFIFPWIVPVLVLVAVQTMFVAGIGLIVGVVNVYFRDTQYLVGIVLQLWFYLTPVVYPVSLVPARATISGVSIPVGFIYNLNPMVRFAETYRNFLYNLAMPSTADMVYLVVVSALSLAVGLFVFARLEPKLAEEL